MRPAPGEVLHFSEDPTIERFVPRRAATQQIDTVHVWAVDERHAPSYWFPRDCPRAMAWAAPTTTSIDRERILGPACPRVHVIEYGWLDAMRTARLYAYRLPAERFRSLDDGFAFVSDDEVTPLGPPVPVGDLLAAHRDAEIQLRLVDNVWPFWRAVVGSTLDYSAIRLTNAIPHPLQATFGPA